MQTLFTYGGQNPFNGAKTPDLITLEQHANPQRFAVTYGLQRKTGLTYAQAAADLGGCILHFLACEGVLTTDPEKE